MISFVCSFLKNKARSAMTTMMDLTEGVEEERSDDGSDSEGSLKDFIGDDEEEEVVAAPKTQNDMEGIDEGNILKYKRVSRPVKRYETEVFGSAEYRKMILDDVPDDEMEAALGADESGEEEGEEEEDDESEEYDTDEEGSDDKEEDEGEETDESDGEEKD